MRKFLPATREQRLVDLRNRKGVSASKVAEAIGVDSTTYRRIENGSTKTISSDILCALADYFGVNTDYILCRSDIPYMNYYDLARLGLSTKSAEVLCSLSDYSEVINGIIEDKNFTNLIWQSQGYLTGQISSLNFAMNSLADFNGKLLNKTARSGMVSNADEDIQQIPYQLSNQKGGTNELENIKSTMATIIGGIKKRIDEEKKQDNLPTSAESRKMDSENLSEILKNYSPIEMPEKTREEQQTEIDNWRRNVIEAFANPSEEEMEELIKAFNVLGDFAVSVAAQGGNIGSN